MPCCRCCCGQTDCAEGQQGKCCCGGVEGTCCQEGEYCCGGTCQPEPCDGCTGPCDEENPCPEGCYCIDGQCQPCASYPYMCQETTYSSYSTVAYGAPGWSPAPVPSPSGTAIFYDPGGCEPTGQYGETTSDSCDEAIENDPEFDKINTPYPRLVWYTRVFGVQDCSECAESSFTISGCSGGVIRTCVPASNYVGQFCYPLCPPNPLP